MQYTAYWILCAFENALLCLHRNQATRIQNFISWFLKIGEYGRVSVIKPLIEECLNNEIYSRKFTCYIDMIVIQNRNGILLVTRQISAFYVTSFEFIHCVYRFVGVSWQHILISKPNLIRRFKDVDVQFSPVTLESCETLAIEIAYAQISPNRK